MCAHSCMENLYEGIVKRIMCQIRMFYQEYVRRFGLRKNFCDWCTHKGVDRGRPLPLFSILVSLLGEMCIMGVHIFPFFPPFQYFCPLSLLSLFSPLFFPSPSPCLPLPLALSAPSYMIISLLLPPFPGMLWSFVCCYLGLLAGMMLLPTICKQNY